MSLKILFKFVRSAYRGTNDEVNIKIKQDLTNALTELSIDTNKIFNPSRDSIKAIFPNEGMINKTLKKSGTLQTKGFDPRLSITLKASRTVYIYNIDSALLATYTHTDIKEHLQTDS